MRFRYANMGDGHVCLPEHGILVRQYGLGTYVFASTWDFDTPMWSMDPCVRLVYANKDDGHVRWASI